MPSLNVNEFLIERYNRGNEKTSSKPIKECKTDRESQPLLESLQYDFTRGLATEEFKLPDLDLDEVFVQTLPDGVPGVFASNPTPKELREAAVAIKASNWDQYFDRCIQTTFSSLACAPAPFTLAACFTPVDRTCSDFDNRQVCEIIDPKIQAPCDEDSEDDQEIFWVGLGDRRCWKMPRLCTSKIGFALHRNLRCMGGTEQVSTLMDQAIRRSFGREDERARVRIMFGLDSSAGGGPCLGCNYPFQVDNVVCNSGYQVSAGGSWQNVVTGAAFALTACNDALLCAFEQIWQKARDPFTCDPVDCGGPLQLAIPDICRIPDFHALAGPQARLVHAGGACDTEITTTRAPLAGWTTEVKYSRYMWDELVNFYKTCQFSYINSSGALATGGLPAGTDSEKARTAESWAANTYLVSKSFPDTFTWMLDFDVTPEELSGTDTESYLHRGIILQRVYRYKRGPGWSRPWLTMLVRGFDPAVNPVV